MKGEVVLLTAIMFVSETTGQLGFIVPAPFAAIIAELVLCDQSVTSSQRNPESPI